jgi:hypothetical protein
MPEIEVNINNLDKHNSIVRKYEELNREGGLSLCRKWINEGQWEYLFACLAYGRGPGVPAEAIRESHNHELIPHILLLLRHGDPKVRANACMAIDSWAGDSAGKALMLMLDAWQLNIVRNSPNHAGDPFGSPLDQELNEISHAIERLAYRPAASKLLACLRGNHPIPGWIEGVVARNIVFLGEQEGFTYLIKGLSRTDGLQYLHKLAELDKQGISNQAVIEAVTRVLKNTSPHQSEYKCAKEILDRHGNSSFAMKRPDLSTACDPNKLKRLVLEGMDIDAKDENGITALQEYAAMGSVEAVKNLLSAGANPLIRLPGGKSLQDVVKHNLSVHEAARTDKDRMSANSYRTILDLLQNVRSVDSPSHVTTLGGNENRTKLGKNDSKHANRSILIGCALFIILLIAIIIYFFVRK